MIRQHYLQQERLKYNHDRLLDRFTHLNSPHISQFRAFGTSTLPGRNYEQHLSGLSGGGNQPRRDSLVALSRASINEAGETYEWMNNKRSSESLPRKVSSVIQYTRKPKIPLVHAEKFEPVHVYEHPIFGPTPAYIRPISNEKLHTEETHDDSSDVDADNEVSSIHEHAEELKRTSSRAARNKNTTADRTVAEDDSPDHAPKGYISYKKWKRKYENLLPVNPLLFNIYTQRPNGSINRYGQSLYTSSDFSRRPGDPDDLFSPAASENGSVSSEIPRVDPSSLNRRYSRLQPLSMRSAVAPRSLEPIDPGYSSDDEISPPESPVPYLSRNQTNLLTPTTPSLPITNTPSTSTRPILNVINPVFPRLNPLNTTNIPPAPPILPTLSTMNVPSVPSAPSISSVLSTTNTSNIPPAPPIPSALSATNTSNIPRAPSISSVLSATNTSNIPPAPPIPSALSATNTSNIPPAPPMPSSLSAIQRINSYQTPSNLPVTLPMSTAGPSATYQAPSNISAPPAQSAPAVTGSMGTRAVTFGDHSLAPPVNDDISSSSDSEDEEKVKRRRQKKRQAAGGDAESSSSDD